MLEFFLKACTLKRVKRKGWLVKAGVSSEHAESVADHSYTLALMAMVMADVKGLDACKAMRFALLHDLAEALTGDYMPEEMDGERKRAMEHDAMLKMLAPLPEHVRGMYSRLWDEYRNCSSDEARLVHELDKLEMVLQARCYEEMGYRGTLDRFYSYAEPYITYASLRELLLQMKKY
ncbi:MAG: HD domain-containing protein [Candidatus Nitrosocaldus sp.]|nr:HD domain-containing protein [Candidatus Nitrosocaldus sp.]MDW8000608.1 HD domain-containing protein [Candidatus Nitrosocaldus sp.]